MDKNNVDQLFQITMNMSERNPGALSYIMQIIRKGETDTRYVDLFTWLYVNKIKGTRLYKLINDCCDGDFEKLIKVINSNISLDTINSYIDHEVRGYKFTSKEINS